MSIYSYRANSLGHITTLRRLFLLLLCTVVWSACTENNPDPEPGTITEQYTSATEGGVVKLDDFNLIVTPNSIPQLTDGSDATVTFSIESGGELPKNLPTEIDKKGTLVHFGPEGFVFQEPLFVLLPLPDNTTAGEVSIVTFDNTTESYKVYPTTYYDTENNIIGTGVYNLGYFFLASVDGVNKTTSEEGQGGFRLCQTSCSGGGWYPVDGVTWNLTGDNGPWYAVDNYHELYLNSLTYKYPEQENWYIDEAFWVVKTVPNVTGWKPNHTRGLTFNGPQGNYTWGLRISHKYFQLDLPECQDYSLPWSINVDKALSCGFSGCDNYTSAPELSSDGSWTVADCTTGKPLPTIPVCTGDFQATLTWHNGSSGDTDLDLHLHGPNGLDVDWTNTTGEGGILLDRDVINTPGYVQENICALNINEMPKGDYTIEVHHFSGIAKDFQVRIVRENYSKSYSSNLSDNATFVVESFTLN